MQQQPDHSSSVWELTAAKAPVTSSLMQDAICDVAIIGAGLTGLNAALHLGAKGKSVVVLEAKDIGEGASGRNGGQIVPGLKHDPDVLLQIDPSGRLLNFAGGCADDLFAFIRTHKLQCDAVQNGWLQPAITSGQLALVQNRARQWRQKGLDVQILDRRAVEEATGTGIYSGGWIDPRGGTLQPLSYVRELARAAMSAGAALHTHSPVDRILQSSTGGWRLSAASRKVMAEHVIIATNGETGPLVADLQKSFFPAHSIQIATEPLPPEIRSAIIPCGLPVSDARRLLKYFRLDRDGRFMIGGRGSFGSRETGGRHAGLRLAAEHMFPQLRAVSWTNHWAGKIALTRDHLPHLHNPAPGLLAALGYNGRGVALASRIGVLLAELSLGMPAKDSPLPVSPLKRIPFHAFRRPALEVAVVWYRVLDRLGQ